MGARLLNGSRLFGVVACNALVYGMRLCVAQFGVAVRHAHERACRKRAIARELPRDTLVQLDRLLQVAVGTLSGKRLLKQVISALRGRRCRVKDEQCRGGEQRELRVHPHESPLLWLAPTLPMAPGRYVMNARAECKTFVQSACAAQLRLPRAARRREEVLERPDPCSVRSRQRDERDAPAIGAEVEVSTVSAPIANVHVQPVWFTIERREPQLVGASRDSFC